MLKHAHCTVPWDNKSRSDHISLLSVKANFTELVRTLLNTIYLQSFCLTLTTFYTFFFLLSSVGVWIQFLSYQGAICFKERHENNKSHFGCSLKNNFHSLENCLYPAIHRNKQDASQGFVIVALLIFLREHLISHLRCAYCQSPDIQRKKCESVPDNNPLKCQICVFLLGEFRIVGEQHQCCWSSTGKTSSQSVNIEYLYFANSGPKFMYSTKISHHH